MSDNSVRSIGYTIVYHNRFLGDVDFETLKWCHRQENSILCLEALAPAQLRLKQPLYPLKQLWKRKLTTREEPNRPQFQENPESSSVFKSP